MLVVLSDLKFSNLIIPTTMFWCLSSYFFLKLFFMSVLHSAVISSFTFYEVIISLPLCSSQLSFLLCCLVSLGPYLIKFLASTKELQYKNFLSPEIKVSLNVYFIYILQQFLFLIYSLLFCLRFFSLILKHREFYQGFLN